MTEAFKPHGVFGVRGGRGEGYGEGKGEVDGARGGRRGGDAVHRCPGGFEVAVRKEDGSKEVVIKAVEWDVLN